MATLSELRQRSTGRRSCHSLLMAIFCQDLRVDLIEQLTRRYRLLHGPDFDADLQRVRRLIESELRHHHKFGK